MAHVAAGKHEIVTLRIELLDTSPPVWRKLGVRADTRLSKLHRWVGGHFDPAAFDVHAVSARLASIR